MATPSASVLLQSCRFDRAISTKFNQLSDTAQAALTGAVDHFHFAFADSRPRKTVLTFEAI